MPEGHTLHRLAGTIGRRLVGHEVASSSPQGRFERGAALVHGHELAAAEAVGKHLLVSFADLAEQVHVHLGLYGSFRFSTVVSDEEPAVVGQVRWRLRGASTSADLRGPTACEVLAPEEVQSLFARLGPDPLRGDADGDRAWARISRSRAPVATLLMDQAVVAGIGNVYRAELLFRHGVAPDLAGRVLPREVWDAMWEDLRMLMRDGVRTGRIDTVRAEHADLVDRTPRPRHGGEVYVYRRDGQPCLLCGTPVLTSVLGGRNLFWCPRCQGADRLGR